MAVSVEGTTTTAHTGSTSFSHDNGSQDRRLLLVFVSGSYYNPASAVTCGGQSLTQQGSTLHSDKNYSTIWYLINPPADENTIVVTCGNYKSCTSALTLYEASQDSANLFTGVETQETINPSYSVGISSDASGLVVDYLNASSSGGVGGRAAGQTERAEWGYGGPGNTSLHAITSKAGDGGDVSMTGSGYADDDMTLWAACILPPQDVTVDLDSVPASAGANAGAGIGTVDDGNITIDMSNVPAVGSPAATAPSVLNEDPIRAVLRLIGFRDTHF